MKKSLIIVSNRLPISVSKVRGTLEYSLSNGGLATAMSSLDTDEEKIWIGWPGISSDEITSAEKRHITDELKKSNCVPIFLTKDEIKLFYEGYSNDTLWPLFHYFQSFTKHHEEYWHAYTKVNRLYLKAVKTSATDQAKIWVHDYQLMLLPKLIRQKIPDSLIGFFLHIPFPSYEIYRLLPERREILEGMLGADLLGFHIYDYARHFMSSVLRTLGIHSQHGTLHYQGRSIRVDAFPIGIDYKKFEQALEADETKAEIANIRKHYKNQKIIMSVDRLDYSKGIVERLEAFEIFLKDNPKYHKNVALVIVAVPSRTEVDTYKNLRDAIELAVSRINGMYGSVDWAPISYQFKNLPFPKIVALYSQSDVALVTPLRDGMNLIAKEYIATKKYETGVLVLSEMAGAIDELPESLSVNPNNSRSMATVIKKALTMPKKEQRSRLDTMQKRISSYTVQKWGNDFMEQLDEIKASKTSMNEKTMSKKTLIDIQTDFQNAKQRLLLLDYDGTLKGYSSSPAQHMSAPSKNLKTLLARLLNIPHTKVCIMSGRDKQTLEKWFRELPLILVAEHGAWVKQEAQWSQIETSFNHDKKDLLPILQKYADRTAGAVIEVKDFALVWHYRNVPAELAYIRTANLKRELQNVLAETDIGVYSGNKILEVKLKDVHKGFAAADILALNQSDFILCAGDDYTDEDMFKALSETAYTLKVGPGETSAQFQVSSHEDVITLLRSLGM